MIQDNALRIIKTVGIENLPEECRCEHNWYIEINTLEELMNFTKKYCNAIVLFTYDKEFDEEIEYNIVGSNEVDPLCGKISDQSPIGHALMGKSAGAEVVAETPSGLITLKILEVYRK